MKKKLSFKNINNYLKQCRNRSNNLNNHFAVKVYSVWHIKQVQSNNWLVGVIIIILHQRNLKIK